MPTNTRPLYTIKYCDDIPTHPLDCGWQPSGCHPVIAAIPNWRMKIAWPCPRAARLRRKMLKRGIRLGLPRQLTNSSVDWSEWESLLNAAQSNMATPSATTYGLRERERNEFWDNPELLRFVCHDGKARGNWPMAILIALHSRM